MGEYFESLIKASPLFEVVTPRSLALTVFRLAPPNLASDESDLNKLNLELHKLVTGGKDAEFITRTELNGKACLRMALGGERTQEEHVKSAFDSFERKARIILEGGAHDQGPVAIVDTEAAEEAS